MHFAVDIRIKVMPKYGYNNEVFAMKYVVSITTTCLFQSRYCIVAQLLVSTHLIQRNQDLKHVNTGPVYLFLFTLKVVFIIIIDM